MKQLNEKQLKNIKGGSISLGAGLLIGAGIVFLIGVVDGYGDIALESMTVEKPILYTPSISYNVEDDVMLEKLLECIDNYDMFSYLINFQECLYDEWTEEMAVYKIKMGE